MPSYISKDGVWHPAKEHAVLPHLAGTSKEVYDGPDRAALFELFQAKQETFGIDFRNDVELINRVRQLGYKSVDDYAEIMGYDVKKAEEEFNKKASKVTLHELPAKVAAIQTMGGGKDLSGLNKSHPGGFGEARIDV